MTNQQTGGQPDTRRPRRRVLWVVLPIFVAFIHLAGIRGANGGWEDGRDGGWGDGGTDHTPDGPLLGVGLGVLGLVLALLGPAALLFIQRYPRTVVAIAVSSSGLYFLTGSPPGPVFVAPLVALVAWMTMVRRERAAEARRVRAAEAESRDSTERLRIAQELHDVLGHHISLINVQSGVALHLIDEQPEQARTALAAIKNASREVLTELRSALDTLRNPGDAAPRAPGSGLAELPAIIDTVRGAGLDIDFRIEGEQRDIPTTADLAALRIVQESLTNVIRHADADRAEVRLTYTDDRLLISVADNGRGGVPVRGNGLSGMATRAEALGGHFSAGPRSGAGFEVRAVLPFDVG